MELGPWGAVLLGPIQAAAYLLNHGFMGAALGAMWRCGSPWWLSIPVGTLVRVGGTLAYIALSSWALNENLFLLVLGNIYSLVVRVTALHCAALELHSHSGSALTSPPFAPPWGVKYTFFPECKRAVGPEIGFDTGFSMPARERG